MLSVTCVAQVSSDEDSKDIVCSKEQSSPTKLDCSAGSKLDTATCSVPLSHEGFLLKSRKSPMKGWHKVKHSVYQCPLSR